MDGIKLSWLGEGGWMPPYTLWAKQWKSKAIRVISFCGGARLADPRIIFCISTFVIEFEGKQLLYSGKPCSESKFQLL